MIDQSNKESISTPSHGVLTIMVMSLSPNLVAERNSTPSGLKGPYMGRIFRHVQKQSRIMSPWRASPPSGTHPRQ